MIGTVVAVIGALVVFVVLAILLVELALRGKDAFQQRFLVENISRKDFIDPDYHPYLNWAEDWSHAMFRYLPIGFRVFNPKNAVPGKVVNNTLGMRCPELTPPAEDELTVVVLGGSAAWGAGASSNATTIAGHLEALINADPALLGDKKRARVFNMAQVNGCQTQDILSAVFMASRVKPQMVISFTGWNELVTSYGMKPEILDGFGCFYISEMEGWEPLRVQGQVERTLAEAGALWLKKRFALARALNVGPKPVSSGFSYSVDGMMERLALTRRLFIDHLAHLNRLSRAYGFTHLQVMQPNLYRKPRLSPSEAKIIQLYDDVRPIHGGKEIGDFLRGHHLYAPILDHARNHPDEMGSVLDLYDMFAEEEKQVFFTLVHCNDEGYRLVAQRIHAALGGLMPAAAV